MRWWRWKNREQDLERELRSDLELETEEQLAKGLSAEEARYAAQRAFGNTTLLKEDVRKTWGWTSLERLGQDLRYAVRLMKGSPGFTMVAVLSLGLGIGGNTAIFSLMNAVMMRSLPVQEPDRLVLFGAGREGGIDGDLPSRSWELFSYPFYRLVQRENQVFSGVTAMQSLGNDVHAMVEGAAAPEPVRARLVAGTYFSVLGVNAAVGHTFTDTEDQTPGADPVAVMSYSWWRRRFGGAPVVGKTLTIGSTVYKIIGVAAPEFFGTSVGESPDVWIPLAMNAQLPPGWGGAEARRDPSSQSLYILARLRPGAGIAQANAQVNLIFKQSLHARVGSNPSAKELNAIQRAIIELTPGGSGLSQVRNRFATSLQLLMGAVGLVLLIACANIANLLLARAANRQREIAVRLSIGASRPQIIRQMLTESMVLSMLGGVVGIAFADVALRLLLWMVSGGGETLPIDVRLDSRVLAFTTLLTVATGILFGLAPALRATRVELTSSLKEGRGSISARSRNVLAKALIVSQVALSAVLLIGAGMFVRSLANLRNVDTGFNKENVLVMGVDASLLDFKENDPRLVSLYRQVEERVSQVPGVRSAGFAMLTFQPGSWTDYAFVQGRAALPDDDQREIHNDAVGPGFFAAMGTPITLGRGFRMSDTSISPKVAVINETMARRFFSGESPIGLRFGLSPERSGEFEVVGVVKDAKYESLREKPTPMAFYPYARGGSLGQFVVRYAGDVRSILPEIRRAFAEVNRNLPITEVKTLTEWVDDTLTRDKLMARLSSFFGLLALLLASIGIYGVLSYAVSRRTSEVGLRMALGAPRSNVLWLVMRDVLALTAIGVAIGVPAALASEWWISGLLYGLTKIDSWSIAAAIGILAVVAGIAAYLPARRASLVDPTTALRYE